MELAAGQSFNNIQLLKCLHQPDYYLSSTCISEAHKSSVKWEKSLTCLCVSGICLEQQLQKCRQRLCNPHWYPPWARESRKASAFLVKCCTTGCQSGGCSQRGDNTFQQTTADSAGVPAKEQTKNCSVEVPVCFM